MKSKLRSTLALTVAALLAMATLTGCGGEKTSSSSNSEGTAAQTATSAPVAEKEKVELKFLHYQVEAVDAFQKVIDDFNKENPNIEVSMDAIPTKDWSTVISMRIAANDIPDVLGIHPVPDIKKSYPAVIENNILMDLSDQPMLSNFGDVFSNDVKVDGKVHMIPLSVNPYGVFYNKDLFKQLNLSVPTTWKEFMDVCKVIQEAGTTPIGLGAKDGWPVEMYEIGLSPTILGVKYPDGDFYQKAFKGETSYNDPVYLEIFTKFQEVSQYFNENPLGVGYNEAPALFVSGKVAMLPDLASSAPMISEANPSFEVGMFAMPGSDTVAPSTIPVKMGLCMAVSNQSEHKEESIKFIEYLAKTEVYAEFVKTMKYLPTQTGITSDDKLVNEVSQYISSGKNVPFSTNTRPPELKMANRLTAWQKLITKDFTPQDAVDFYVKNLEEDRALAGE
jgi:raffinose/stachyose/melibiose transport system substrate-binding protein